MIISFRWEIESSVFDLHKNLNLRLGGLGISIDRSLLISLFKLINKKGKQYKIKIIGAQKPISKLGNKNEKLSNVQA